MSKENLEQFTREIKDLRGRWNIPSFVSWGIWSKDFPYEEGEKIYDHLKTIVNILEEDKPSEVEVQIEKLEEELTILKQKRLEEKGNDK